MNVLLEGIVYTKITIPNTQVLQLNCISRKKELDSPDLNPIENVWGSLKQYLRNVYKPKNLEELKSGIQQFWQMLTPERCTHYINHLRKVIPEVIQEGGGPSGY